MNKILTFVIALVGIGLLSTQNAYAGSSHHNGSYGDSMVRVLHASPNAPAVDVLVNDNKVLSNVAFSDISGYLNLPGGSYNVKVRPAGQESPDVINTDISVNGGKKYTVVAAGNLDEIHALVFEDRVNAPRENRARVRVIHLSPDAPAVDVVVNDSKKLVRHLTFMESSNYKKASPGTYDIDVNVSGTDTTALSIPGVNLEGGKAYTVFALGYATGSPALSAKLVVDAE